VGLVLATLMQCRPIDLSEGWSFATDQGGVIAKVVCQCSESGDSKQASYVMQTQDVRQTCSEGNRLCESVCSSPNH